MSTLAHSILDVSASFLQLNKISYKSFDEFKLRSDPITNYRVSCPLASEKQFIMLLPL